jgi:hypothetical protein
MLGLCRGCNSPIGSGNKPCPHCGLEDPMPPPVARGKCTTCAKLVTADLSRCPHCGAPEPMQLRASTRRMVKCRQCAQPMSAEVLQCPKCKAATAEPEERDATDACRTCGRTVPAVSGPCKHCGARDWTVKTPIGKCATCGEPVSLEARPSHCQAPDPVVADASQQKAAALPTRCGRCGADLPAPGAPCEECQRAQQKSPQAQKPTPPMVLGWRDRAVRLTVIVIAGLGAAGLLRWSLAAEPSARDRRERIARALGDGASERAVEKLDRDAKELGLPIDDMLRIHRVCAFDPSARPAPAELRAVREAAVQTGGDGVQAMVAFAKQRCR